MTATKRYGLLGVFSLKSSCRRRGGVVVFRQGMWEALPIIVGILIISVLVVWIAWSAFEFLAADAPAVVRIKVR